MFPCDLTYFIVHDSHGRHTTVCYWFSHSTVGKHYIADKTNSTGTTVHRYIHYFPVIHVENYPNKFTNLDEIIYPLSLFLTTSY